MSHPAQAALGTCVPDAAGLASGGHLGALLELEHRRPAPGLLH